MRIRSLYRAVAAVALGPGLLSAQALSTPATGPVIRDFGPVYQVDAPDFPTPTGETIRAVFDVAEGAPEAADLNRRIESLARFLNMHARAGVDPASMELALVVHGSAGKDLLGHEGYRRRYGVDNPNLALLNALMDAGVDVILCGQTQAARGLERSELAPGVKVALSAMTALVTLQSRGYRLAAN